MGFFFFYVRWFRTDPKIFTSTNINNFFSGESMRTVTICCFQHSENLSSSTETDTYLVKYIYGNSETSSGVIVGELISQSADSEFGSFF